MSAITVEQIDAQLEQLEQQMDQVLAQANQLAGRKNALEEIREMLLADDEENSQEEDE